MIESGSAANGSLRALTQGATFLVDAIGALPQPVIGAGVAVTALAGGCRSGRRFALRAIPSIAAFRVAAADDEHCLRAAAGVTGVAGAGIAALAFGVGAAISILAKQKALTDELTESLDKQTGAHHRTTPGQPFAKGNCPTRAFSSPPRRPESARRNSTDAVLEGGSAYEDVKNKLGGKRLYCRSRRLQP